MQDNTLLKEFTKRIGGVSWTPSSKIIATLESLVRFASENGYVLITSYDECLTEAINNKLDLNSESYRRIIDTAFVEGLKLNYADKIEIRKSLDKGDKDRYISFLKKSCFYTEKMIDSFAPVSFSMTFDALKSVLEQDEKAEEILNSIFARFCFYCFPDDCTATFFSNGEFDSGNYYLQLEKKYPKITSREHALSYLIVDQSLFIESYENGCSAILRSIESIFEEMNNHCDLAVYIPSIEADEEDIQWSLFRDILLFSEKHSKGGIDKPYFRWKEVQKVTEEYLGKSVLDQNEWENAYQGFVYKDCFILGENDSQKKYDILLILEKNVRDERVINCPACCSNTPQGNSYPILNVKSWECENPLCPDRSKYNRGKRYAFLSLIRQRELNSDENRIPQKSIQKWHLDVVDATPEEAFEMCLKHYSFVGDGVYVYTSNGIIPYSECYGRIIASKKIQLQGKEENRFFESAFFKRYIVNKRKQVSEHTMRTISKASVYNGDAFEVLCSLDDDSIDAAVTSPPYYNAKAYSQWPNIYCYLYDMYNVSLEIYRTLKPGGVYLFNIFDYFDNENNIVFSAMGKKRLILSAYLLDIFKRVGFTLNGNIVWYKGEIQGNRSFNQGNLTPYYQAPLNCWEPVFILSKGKMDTKFASLSSYVKHIHPVVKMIKGKNVLGHTAPYPEEIPSLIINCLNPEDVVLDPYLGSGTTSIVANKHNINSIGIELSDEYYKLCCERIAEQQLSNYNLFD